MYTAATSTTGVPTVNPDQDYGDNPVDNDFFAVTRLRRQYTDYLTAKALEIEEQKQGRHYYHGAQYTSEEVRILRARRQPIITYNRVGRKINGIVGTIQKLRQDPKAFPRHPSPQNDSGATIATETIRYVLDANQFMAKDAEAAKQCAIEGIGGVELRLTQGDHGDPDIEICNIAGDDFFYDPRSYRYDFTDARFMGIAKWLDVEEAAELFPDKAELIRGLIENGYDLTTHADREYKWIYVNERRVRLVEHWYKFRGKWRWAFYISFHLLDQGTSPFMDGTGKTMPRFIMFSAAVDHDGDRYGFVRNLKGPQDEINQRRSKALFISNTRRLILDKGAVDDVETARREWARPDGVIEKNPNLAVQPDDTSQDLAGQFQFLEEAKNEIEQYANTNPAALVSGTNAQNLSGRAVSLLQAPGMAELGPFILSYRDWKIRVYKAIWSTCQQFWTSERWIRVSGDDNLAKFIQINGLDLDQHGLPMIVNHLGSLDVDIIMDEGPDVVNMMADTFGVLSQLPPGSVPPAAVVELAPIQASVKQKILAMMQQKDPMQQQAQQLDMQRMAAAIRFLLAQAEEKASASVANQAKAQADVALGQERASKAHANYADIYRQGWQDVVAHSQALGAPVPPPPAGQGMPPAMPQAMMPPQPQQASGGAVPAGQPQRGAPQGMPPQQQPMAQQGQPPIIPGPGMRNLPNDGTFSMSRFDIPVPPENQAFVTPPVPLF